MKSYKGWTGQYITEEEFMKHSRPKQLLLAIDGNYYLHKCWYHIPSKVRKNPKLVSRMLAKKMLDFICTDYNLLGATHLCVAFDGGRNFRYELYPMYKANRNPDGDGSKERERGEDGLSTKELYNYLDAVVAFLKKAGLPVVQHPLYEADDILRTLAELPTNVILGTRDKDQHQSLKKNVRMWYSLKGVGYFITLKDAEKKWGIPHKLFLEYQTLLGDRGDNVPTIPFKEKTGPVTIKNLLKKHGSIKGIYEKGTEHERKVLVRSQKQVRINRQLVTLVANVFNPTPKQLSIKKVAPEPGWPSSYMAISEGDKLFGSTKPSSMGSLLRGRRRRG